MFAFLFGIIGVVIASFVFYLAVKVFPLTIAVFIPIVSPYAWGWFSDPQWYHYGIGICWAVGLVIVFLVDYGRRRIRWRQAEHDFPSLRKFSTVFD